jgi:hypothetical protein
MAARDEGYSVGVNGTYLNELRTPEGKEPIPRYTSIALYRDGHLVRSYAIRIETGDIVDPSVCKVFRYPDLIGFKKKIMNEFHTKDVPLEVIESEVGCDTLRVAPPSGKHAADGPS